MRIATLGPTSGSVGKTITLKRGTFILQDHGPISPSDVMRYDQQGHLVWANNKTRAWVEAKAQAATIGRNRRSAESILTQQQMRSARRVLTWNAWFFVALGVFGLSGLILGGIATSNVNPAGLTFIALFYVVPAAVILFTRPVKPTAVRRWLVATSLGDFGWAVVLGNLARVDSYNSSSFNGSTEPALLSIALVLGVFGILSWRGVRAVRKGIEMGLEPEPQVAGRPPSEPAGSSGEAPTVPGAESSVAIPGSGDSVGIAGPRPEIATSGPRPRFPRQRRYLILAVVGVVVAVIVAVAIVAIDHKGTSRAGTSAIDRQTQAAVNTLKKNPTDPAALLTAAKGYQNAAVQAFFSALSSSSAARSKTIQTNDLTKALGYYRRYLALPDSALGTAATRLRFTALSNEASIYSKLDDYASAAAAYGSMLELEPQTPLNELGITPMGALAGTPATNPQYKVAVTIYKDMLKLQPHNTALYLQLADSDAVVGDNAGAIAAYETYLKLEPHSQYAAQVKAAVAKLRTATTAVYRNAQLGFAFRYDPTALTVDDSASSPFMTMFKTDVLPQIDNTTFKAHIGGLVVCYPKSWSVSQGRPAGFATIIRDPPVVPRSLFARLNTAVSLRKIAANIQTSARSTSGLKVTAVPTHVGHLPAITETIRTAVTANGQAFSIRYLLLFTPTSEYVFIGYADRSDESTYFPLFDEITSSLTVSK